jgi:hypothetical protein
LADVSQSLLPSASSLSGGAVAPTMRWRGEADLKSRYYIRKRLLNTEENGTEAPVLVLALVLGLREGAVDAGEAAD